MKNIDVTELIKNRIIVKLQTKKKKLTKQPAFEVGSTIGKFMRTKKPKSTCWLKNETKVIPNEEYWLKNGVGWGKYCFRIMNNKEKQNPDKIPGGGGGIRKIIYEIKQNKTKNQKKLCWLTTHKG